MHNFIKSSFKFLLLLIANITNAQRSNFNDFPLAGKVKAYEIVVLSGDSIVPKEKLLEKKTFNKDGIALTTIINSEQSSCTSYQEKTIERDGTFITYQCQCSKIDDFIKYFKFKDPSEKYERIGGAVAEPPNRFVTVKAIDGRKNVMMSELYSQEGYKLTRTNYKYDRSQRLVNRVTHDDMDSIIYNETNIYDKQGNLINQIIKATEYPFDVNEKFKYDLNNNLMEHLKYDKQKLAFHYQYKISESNNKKSIIEIDKLKGDTTGIEEVYYNAKHQEIKRLTSARYGMASRRVESDYYESDILKSKTYFRNDTMLYQRVEFANDKYNNWVMMQRYQLETSVNKNERKTGIRQTIYRQKIEW